MNVISRSTILWHAIRSGALGWIIYQFKKLNSKQQRNYSNKYLLTLVYFLLGTASFTILSKIIEKSFVQFLICFNFYPLMNFSFMMKDLICSEMSVGSLDSQNLNSKNFKALSMTNFVWKFQKLKLNSLKFLLAFFGWKWARKNLTKNFLKSLLEFQVSRQKKLCKRKLLS